MITAGPLASRASRAGSITARFRISSVSNQRQGGLMATRGNTTFQKRQKEVARKDKQKRKAERRAERKLSQADSDHGSSGSRDSSSDVEDKAQPEVDAPNPFSGTHS